MNFKIISKYKNSMVNGDIIIKLEKEKQEMMDCLTQGIKHNIEYGCFKKCVYPFKSEFCEKCSKMKTILVIEKQTGLKIEEIIK